MKEIKLTNDRGVALVDDEDYEMLSQYKWRLNDRYIITNIKINNKWTNKSIHRLIMNEPKEMYVDHIDHNSLNNQKFNLRIVTNSQNQMNRKKFKISSSNFKGVCWYKRDKKWRAYITINKKNYYLGAFKDEVNAAIAYNNKAMELHGKYANLNEV